MRRIKLILALMTAFVTAVTPIYAEPETDQSSVVSEESTQTTENAQGSTSQSTSAEETTSTEGTTAADTSASGGSAANTASDGTAETLTEGAAAADTAAQTAGTADTASQVTVSSFLFLKQSEDRYRLSWTLGNISTTNVYVRFYVSSDASGELSGVELGGMESGANGIMYVDLPDMDSGYYHFIIQILSSSAPSVYAYSEDAFFFDNKSRDPQLSGIIGGREDKTVYAIWDGGEAARVFLYDADTKALVSESVYNTTPAEIVIPEGVKNVEVGVASCKNETGRFIPFECSEDVLDKAQVEYPEEDITNNSVMPVSIDARDCEIRVFNNQTENTVAEDVKDLELALSEGMNKVCIFMTDKHGVTKVATKSITLDTIPPQIDLVEDFTDWKTTDEAVYIKGSTEEGASLICDGTEAATVGNYFCIRKGLNLGINTIRLSASDKAGNETLYVINITRSFWTTQNKFLIPIIIAAVVILLAELYMLFIRGRRKKND